MSPTIIICTPIPGQENQGWGIIMRYDEKFKRKCIEMYLKYGSYPETPEDVTTKTFHRRIRDWAHRYEINEGVTIVRKRHKAWTPDEKLELVQRAIAGNSVTVLAAEADINPSVLYGWIKRYRIYGYEGLANKKKGRRPKGLKEMPEEKIIPKELSESEREELLRLRAENEYLKAETAAIKKLMALRREKEATQLKARKQSQSKNSEEKDTD